MMRSRFPEACCLPIERSSAYRTVCGGNLRAFGITCIGLSAFSIIWRHMILPRLDGRFAAQKSAVQGPSAGKQQLTPAKNVVPELG